MHLYKNVPNLNMPASNDFNWQEFLTLWESLDPDVYIDNDDDRSAIEVCLTKIIDSFVVLLIRLKHTNSQFIYLSKSRCTRPKSSIPSQYSPWRSKTLAPRMKQTRTFGLTSTTKCFPQMRFLSADISSLNRMEILLTRCLRLLISTV